MLKLAISGQKTVQAVKRKAKKNCHDCEVSKTKVFIQNC